MKNPEALERIAYEVAVDNQEEGVRYLEIRFAPQLHMSEDFSFEEVMNAVWKGLERAKKEYNKQPAITSGAEPPFHYGIIACAMRFCTSAFSPFFNLFFKAHEYTKPLRIITLASEQLARACALLIRKSDIPIVGFDLAGAEDGYPAEDHKEAFQIAHRNFINKTVHAGEAYGPESIFQAITDLHTNRIGHGFYLYDTDKISSRRKPYAEKYVKSLVDHVANTRLTIEVCLTSNLQTNPSLKQDLTQHTFRRMLEDNLSVTICTDNRLVSNTTVTQEFIKAIETFDISVSQLKNIIAYGFKRSFFPGSYTEKRAYVRTVLNYFESVLKQHGIHS